MWLLMVEAGGALLLLVFIVWWTMYAGRAPSSRHPREAAREEPAARKTGEIPGATPGEQD